MGFSLVVGRVYSQIGLPWASSVRWLLMLWAHGLEGPQASVVTQHVDSLVVARWTLKPASAFGARAYLLHDTWDLPRSGLSLLLWQADS